MRQHRAFQQTHPSITRWACYFRGARDNPIPGFPSREDRSAGSKDRPVSRNITSLKYSFRQQVNNLYFEGKLTISHKSVLMTLATFLGREGLFPSHKTIARTCNRSERTVIRALERAYELGLVERTRRMAIQGGKKVRTSNLYRLIVKVSEQARAAGKHMARAVWHRMNHLTAKMSDKVTQNISDSSFGRRYPEPQAPQRSRAEMLAAIASWQT